MNTNPLDWLPIPSVFYSDLTSDLFENCISCNKYLLNDGTQYLIEKAFKSYKNESITSTIFEYAMCFDCYDEMRSKISVISRSKLDDFYENKIDLSKRYTELKGKEVSSWLEKCIVNDSSPSIGGEYQIYGMCDEKDMLFYEMPFMLSGEAIDKMVGLLSLETKDELDDFFKKITSGPPELRKILEERGVKAFI